MKQARYKGWRRGSTPLQPRAVTQCDLTRQGKRFKCTDLSLSPAECCSFCKLSVKVEP